MYVEALWYIYFIGNQILKNMWKRNTCRKCYQMNRNAYE